MAMGSALAVIFLALLSYGLVALGEGIRTVGTTALLLSIPAAILFIIVEARSSAPMLPLKLFRDRNFSGANAITVVLSSVWQHRFRQKLLYNLPRLVLL
jgi:hypothetical protein